MYSPNVDLKISKALITNLSDLKYNEYVFNQPFNLTFNFINSGNIPFKMKGRLDVFDNNSKIFTGWSEENVFKTGEIKNIPIYWFPYNTSGVFTGKLKVYYGTEVTDERVFDFGVRNNEPPENVINLTRLETYDSEMILSLKTDKNLKDVIIIPKEYPPAWFFEQRRIEKLDGEERVKLVYEPSLWESGNSITFQAVTGDGKYYGESTFVIERENLVKRVFYYSSQAIKSFLSSLKI